MTTIVLEELACCHCPFFDGEWGACQVTRAGEREHRSVHDENPEDETPPPWCPLRKGAVTVRAAKAVR